MALYFLLFTGGLLLLTYGAKWVVNGSENIALLFGIRPFIIGVSILAFGTSIPELVFNISAQMKHSGDLGLGNIIGSNIANLALVLGFSAIIRPLKIEKNIIRKEFPILLVVTLLFYLLAWNHVITSFEGGILILLMIIYVWYIIQNAKTDPDFSISIEIHDKINSKSKRWHHLLLTVIGLVVLITGAQLMVDSSIAIAQSFGISQFVIGLTIVAVGTSLPELAASISASIHNESELSVGNIIGSNIFNILLIIGITALMEAIKVHDVNTLVIYFPILISLTFILFIYIFFRKRLGRVEGIILVLFYFGFTYLSYHLK